MKGVVADIDRIAWDGRLVYLVPDSNVVDNAILGAAWRELGKELEQRGVGSEMLSRLIAIARAEKVSRLAAAILPENSDMQDICKRLGFHLHQAPGDPTIQASIEL